MNFLKMIYTATAVLLFMSPIKGQADVSDLLSVFSDSSPDLVVQDVNLSIYDRMYAPGCGCAGPGEIELESGAHLEIHRDPTGKVQDAKGCAGGICWYWKDRKNTDSMYIYRTDLPLKLNRFSVYSKQRSKGGKSSGSTGYMVNDKIRTFESFSGLEEARKRGEEVSYGLESVFHIYLALALSCPLHNFSVKEEKTQYCYSGAVDLYSIAMYNRRVEDLLRGFAMWLSVDPESSKNKEKDLVKALDLYKKFKSEYLKTGFEFNKGIKDSLWAKATLYAVWFYEKSFNTKIKTKRR